MRIGLGLRASTAYAVSDVHPRHDHSGVTGLHAVQEQIAGSVPDQELGPVFQLVEEAEEMAAEGVSDEATRRGSQTAKTAP
jgi:hypothetical protein